MESPSSSLFYSFQEYFSSSDDDLDAVTSVVQPTMEFYVHEVDPPRPIIRGTQVERDRAAANARLMEDYFTDGLLYKDPSFLGIGKNDLFLVLRICHDLERVYPYFQQRNDARGKPGFTVIQKCVLSCRVLGVRKHNRHQRGRLKNDRKNYERRFRTFH
jgi:hypothetical protein